jgi:hypothetical protein
MANTRCDLKPTGVAGVSRFKLKRFSLKGGQNEADSISHNLIILCGACHLLARFCQLKLPYQKGYLHHPLRDL